MKKKILFIITILYSIINIAACNPNNGRVAPNPKRVQETKKKQNDTIAKVIDYNKVKPNEIGKIMVVMYHAITPSSHQDTYSRTVDRFNQDLEIFYHKGYYPMSMKDFIHNRITVPAGKTPILLTFDDAGKSQASFIKEKGVLILKKNTALWIMEDFKKSHPDISMSAIFYLNANPFPGEGTVSERIQKVLQLGYEVGNHTWSHLNLKKASKEEIEENMALVVKMISEADAKYSVESVSRPFGSFSKKADQVVFDGAYKGIPYHNVAALLVGAHPSSGPNRVNFDFRSIPRVRAGSSKENFDLDYWLAYFDKKPQERYISDGDSNTIVVPVKFKKYINYNSLGDKKLVLYELPK